MQLFNKSLYFFLLQTVISCSVATAATQVTGNGTIVGYWNEAMMQQVRPTRPGPPIAARQMAITHTCIYDAWAAYDSKALGTRLAWALRRPVAEHTDVNKKAAISYAAHACLKNLFPTRVAQLDALLVAAGYPVLTTAPTTGTPADIGLKAANAVLTFRATDGSNQTGSLNGGAPYSDYTGYVSVNTSTMVNDPNRWQPLPPFGTQTAPQKFIAPHWEKVKSFSLTSVSMFDHLIPDPAFHPSQDYFDQAADLVTLSANMTDEQKAIIELWADGPDSELPPGHWGLIGQWLSKDRNQSIDTDVKMFFVIHNASFDAGIVAWHIKRKYDYVRPITALRYIYNGQPIEAWGGPGYYDPNNPSKPFAKVIQGQFWSPYNPGSNLTPAFPEYTSGHSIFSRSAADVLTHFYGSNSFGYTGTFPKFTSRVEPGFAPFTDFSWYYPTFRDASDQAAMSRRYGGIHFEDGDISSRILGQAVAKQVWCRAVVFFNDPNLPTAQVCKAP